VDCGATVNPDRVRAQMEGACVMGVAAATLGEITFKNGRAQQDNFNGYEVTRMAESPREIRVRFEKLYRTAARLWHASTPSTGVPTPRPGKRPLPSRLGSARSDPPE